MIDQCMPEPKRRKAMKWQVWECSVVVPHGVLPARFDGPPREAAIEAIERAGIPVLACYSGWAGRLTDAQEYDFIRHVLPHLRKGGRREQAEKAACAEALIAAERADARDRAATCIGRPPDYDKCPGLSPAVLCGECVEQERADERERVMAEVAVRQEAERDS